MQTFNYTARNLRTGEKIVAELEAENEGSAARLLTERGLAPLSIAPTAEIGGLRSLLNRIPSRHMVVFSRQLSTLVNSGLPLVQSLDAVRNQTGDKQLKAVVSKVINDVEAGLSLSQAMAKHPKVFNDIYTSLVAAGETSGTLGASLERLANQQEKDNEIISKLRGALLYPFLVIIVLAGVVTFLMTAVLPQVESLYEGIPGLELPLITKILLAVSSLFLKFWWLLLLILAGGLFGLFKWMQTEAGRAFYDRLKLQVWGAGPLFRKLYMARFARVSSTLITSGVPLLEVLNTSAASIGNVHVAASVHRAAEQVRGGKPLSESLMGDKNFLELVPNMIRTGEQSGSLDEMLSKLADYYEKEVDNQIKSISTVIEPALLIAVGIIALIIVAAVLLPIYSLAGKNIIRV